MRIGRVILFFAFAFGSILIPVVVMLLVGFLGYKPIFTITESMVANTASLSSLTAETPGLARADGGPIPEFPDARQVIRLTYDNGGQALLLQYDTSDQAKQIKDRFLDNVPTDRSSSILDTTRYHRSDKQAYGLLIRDRSWVLASEAPTEEGRTAQLEGLPFLVKQDKSLLSALFEDHLAWFFVGLGLYLLLLLFTWPKIGSWAGQVDRLPGVPPSDVAELKQRLLAVNDFDAPFSVTPGKRDNEFIVEWKYADAKWIGPMSAGGVKALARIRLRLDPARHIVRAQDKNASVRWEARGPTPTAHFNYTTFKGMEFLSASKGKAYGLIFKEGRLTFDKAYDYSFNRAEMKGPIIDVVTGSGWTYRPVISFLPPFG